MKSLMLAASVLLLTLVGCSSERAVVKTGSAALTVSVYSDAEYTALKPRIKTIDDVVSMPKTATVIADGTAVSVLQKETLPIRSDVAPPVDWPFEKIHVLSGPLTGREGWISGYGFVSGAGGVEMQPILASAKP